MEEWKEYRLGEITLGKGSYGIAAPAVPYDKSKYTYLRITDINDDGSLNPDGLKSVNDKNASKYLLHKGDIVFARTGNSTGRTYYYDGTEGPLVYAGFLIKFSLDSSKVNPRLLKYYTHSKPYYEWIHSFDTGATRGNINAQTLGDMPIMLPPRYLQDKIVEILKSIDDKIELNRKINSNLEEQAKALFKSWFIDFEPFKGGKFVESELGMIPEGWKVLSLDEIADYLNGLAMQKFRPTAEEDHLPVLKIKELGQGYCDGSCDICSSDIPSQYIVNDGDVIFSWSGTLMVDVWCGGRCGLNQHLFKVTSKEYPKWFYLMWTLEHLNRFIHIAKDKAVTMGHIKREELHKAKVVVPSTAAINKANLIFAPIVNEIINTRISNRKLSAVRDTLLPKLMSGEISV